MKFIQNLQPEITRAEFLSEVDQGELMLDLVTFTSFSFRTPTAIIWEMRS